MNPIKLHIYSKSGEIKNTYIFIGDVDADIRKCLESTKRGPVSASNASKLKKYYGAKWKELLNISYKGGAENDIDDEITLEELNAIANIKKEVQSEELTEISQSDIPTTNTDTNTKSKLDHKSFANKTVYVYDVNIYPHDNILEFKKKISLVLGIPIYKQHIWYEYSKKRFNLNYNLYLHDKAIQLSFLSSIIMELRKDNSNLEKIEDIPILIDFYNAKKLLSIKAYDTFSVLENIIVELGILEFNLIDLDEFVNPNLLSKLDKASIEVIYYGFIILFWPMFSYTTWLDYAHNPTTFEKIYPDLGLNTESNKKMFNVEKNITDEAQELFTNKSLKKEKDDIEKFLYIGITYATVQVMSLYTSQILNLRNLFDKISLNDNIIACKCSTLHNGQKIIFNKTYKTNAAITTNIPLRSFILRIKTKINILDLYIYPDGNYAIKSKWPEEELYDFNSIFGEVSKLINPIIEMINKFGNYVINSNARIDKLNQKNVKFSEVSVSLIYRKSVKFMEFKILENILKEFESGGIIILNQINPANNTLEYYFSKGMYKFDANRIEKHFVLDNYYNFLTNALVKTKWQQLFTFYRNTTFQYRHGDIKISIEGIKESEFAIFYMYIVSALNKVHTQSKQYMPTRIEKSEQKRNIKSLKTQDPILYDFKKLYNSPIVYSKICQKPYQPIILNNEDYSALNNKDRNRTVKYWNFTTNSDAYYYCPNTRYPYIQFTIKKHPKDYCIPCCKKKSITKNDNKIKQAIFNTCLTDHKYQMEKTNLIQDTRYIMNYGKYISPGRICNLPENSIEPLLYENFSESTAGVEPQCEEQNRYYIYGTEQHSENIKNTGYINILSFSLDISVKDLIHQLLQKIKADPSKFKILLNGQITRYFYSVKELTTDIYNAFLQPLYIKDIPWNELFIDLAYYYLNILTITFVDKSNQFENIKLLIDGKISNPEQILNPNYKTLIVIRKHNYFNPIYYLNSIVFFRTKLITTKLFVHTDEVLKIIQKAIFFNEINKHNLSNKKAEITLSVLNSFANSTQNKHYSISAYFINKDNQCYYIELTSTKSNGSNNIYIPVKFSSYTANDEVDLIHECYSTHKYKMSLKLLNQFIKDFNHWIALESELKGFILENVKKSLPIEQRVNPIYDFIKIDKWLLLSNPYSSRNSLKNSEQVIGFKHNNINYYHEPISKENASKLSAAPFEQLLYHPDSVNAILYKSQVPMMDARIKNITRNIYEYHLYELLLLEFTDIFNKEKNITLRHNIKKQILKTVDVSSIETINKISDFISNYFAEYPNEPDHSKEEDIFRIIDQINLFIVKHHDKKILLNQIDLSFYNFDKVKINYLKTLPKELIIKELLKISKRIVIIVPEQGINKLLSYTEEFPNMLVSCQDRQSKGNIYCKQNKLVITAKKLAELIEIMTADILNPFKQKWLFNVIFTDKILTYFKFAKHLDETITIEIQ
jgi:hypothetical protein